MTQYIIPKHGSCLVQGVALSRPFGELCVCVCGGRGPGGEVILWGRSGLR